MEVLKNQYMHVLVFSCRWNLFYSLVSNSHSRLFSTNFSPESPSEWKDRIGGILEAVRAHGSKRTSSTVRISSVCFFSSAFQDFWALSKAQFGYPQTEVPTCVCGPFVFPRPRSDDTQFVFQWAARVKKQTLVHVYVPGKPQCWDLLPP